MPFAPQPTAQELPELVGQFVQAGLPASLVTTGDTDVDPAVSFAIHRIAQEALTNVLRYSRNPTRVEVAIDYSSDGIDIVVENDGAIMNAPSAGAGQGLRGLRERIDLLGGGGYIETGPAGNGVWRLASGVCKAGYPVGPR